MITWNSLQIVAEIFGIIVLGIFGAIYLFSKSRKRKEEETDKAEDRLVVILKGTVDALEKKVEDLEKAHLVNSKKIVALETENEIVNRVLQGRDGKSEELYKMAKENSENIAKLYSLMERHINLVEKALSITENAQHSPAV